MFLTMRNKALGGESGSHQGRQTLLHKYTGACTCNGFDSVTAALHYIRGLIV